MKGFVIWETFGPTDWKQVVCKKEILTSANWQTLSEAIEGRGGERTAPGVFIGNRRNTDALPKENPSERSLLWGHRVCSEPLCVQTHPASPFWTGSVHWFDWGSLLQGPQLRLSNLKIDFLPWAETEAPLLLQALYGLADLLSVWLGSKPRDPQRMGCAPGGKGDQLPGAVHIGAATDSPSPPPRLLCIGQDPAMTSGELPMSGGPHMF